MKILFIASDISALGGIEKYNRDYLAALKNAGTQVLLVERYKGGFFAKLSFFYRVIFQYFIFRPDYIFCGHLNFSAICLILKKFFNTPFTLALYGIDIYQINTLIKKMAVREAKYIVSIADFFKKKILEQFPEVENRIYMLPSAVNGADFYIKEKSSKLREKWGLQNKQIIVTLARLSTHEYKGQDRVIKAMPLVLEKLPNAVYLVVGGGSDEKVESVLRDIPQLRNHVIFTGPVSNEERVDYYNLGDVFVLPSKFEGFGIVFIESLACGVPVIASDDYGCREALLNGELGLLVPPDNIYEIAQAIIKMLTKEAAPDLFNRDRLRARTIERYGIDAWNQRVKKLVEKLK